MLNTINFHITNKCNLKCNHCLYSSWEKSKNINDISNVKIMNWFNNFYRIRIWDYRIWFKLEWNKIILLRVRSRKDIYNIFP